MQDTDHQSTNLDYAELGPDTIIDAVESLGCLCNGQILALNSYENRVYRVGIEDRTPVIAKFYRPERWTNAQILEEHEFCEELVEADLPVVKPLKFDDDSLFEFNGYRFALYPLQGGRAAEFDNLDNLFTMGRYMGRMHAAASAKSFVHRPSINNQSFGYESASLISREFIPASLKEVYCSVTDELLAIIDQRLSAYPNIHTIRTHGDCHSGNVLWRDDAPHFVDFDDARTAPAIQDIWMLLSGARNEQEIQLSSILEGYEEFARFNAEELCIMEALRSLRIMHYAAWLARRWTDPAFPRAFPWFHTERYWGEHILELKEQLSAMQEPPLRLL